MRRRETPWDYLLLLLLCALGVFLSTVQTRFRNDGRVDPISSVVQTVVSPISGPLGSATRSSGEFFGGLFSARQLTLENQRLRSLAQSAELYQEQLSRLEGEITRLRAISNFPPIPGKTRVPAVVIGYAAYENRITLNVGSNQGIRPGMPVEAPEGFVGTVQTVEAGRCHVLLVISAGLTIGAIDMGRNPPPAGLLRGEGATGLNLTFQDPKANVQIGDPIATSGFSEMIPKGILIGRVISVDADEEFGALRARVFPAVSVGNLREVHVLK